MKRFSEPRHRSSTDLTEIEVAYTEKAVRSNRFQIKSGFDKPDSCYWPITSKKTSFFVEKMAIFFGPGKFDPNSVG